MGGLRDYLFHEEPGVTLYCGDCRDVLPLLSSVDLGAAIAVVIADPPYGETALAWDVPVREWAGFAGRLIAPAGSLWCFGSMRAFMRTAAEWHDWQMSQDIVWEKHNGSGFAADRFKRVHEHAVHFYRGAWREVYKAPPRVPRTGPPKGIRRRGPTAHTGKIGQGSYVDDGLRLMRSVVRVRSEHGRADHPTQKPTSIVRPLISYSCWDSGIVLDPFAGSGSTLIAARESSRRAIGIEIEPRYCEIAVRRLRQEVLPL